MLTTNVNTLVAAFRVTPSDTSAWTRSSRAVKDLAVLPPPALVRVSSALMSLLCYQQTEDLMTIPYKTNKTFSESADVTVSIYQIQFLDSILQQTVTQFETSLWITNHHCTKH